MTGLLQLDAARTAGLLTTAQAADALAGALRSGLDPEACPQRTSVAAPGGELLLMPAASGAYAGVKVAGVAPGNPALGLPRITGSYLLLDGPTLRPLALLDGAALTALRTPAVSALALRYLTAPGRPLRLVVFGAGPQAYGHLEAVLELRELAEAVVVARDPGRAGELAAHARARASRPVPGRPMTWRARTWCCAAPPPVRRSSTGGWWPRGRWWSPSARTSRTPGRRTPPSCDGRRCTWSRGRRRCARRGTC